MPIPPQNDLIVQVSREDANANTVLVLREMREKLVSELEAMISDPPPPAVKLSGKERYTWFLDRIADAYYLGPRGAEFKLGSWADRQDWPQFYDVNGIEQEIALLQMDTLVDGVRAGLLPMPLSRPFANYDGLWLGMEPWRRLFVKLHKQYGETEE